MLVYLIQIYTVLLVLVLLIIGVYRVVEQIVKKRINRIKNRYRKLEQELILNRSNQKLYEEHIKLLSKELLNKNNLIGFSTMIDELAFCNYDEARSYLYNITLVFIIICPEYEKKNLTFRTYLAGIMSRYNLNLELSIMPVVDFYFNLLIDRNMYGRINALCGLIKMFNPSIVINALNDLTKNNIDIQSRVLTESLNLFMGDKELLINLLIDNFKKYSASIKIAIINYIRLNSGEYSKRLFLFLSTETDVEITYALVRYFGKYYYADAGSLILKLGLDSLYLKEYGLSSVCVKALEQYKLNNELDFLSKAITSSDYYVRRNAAHTLAVHYGKKSIALVDKYLDQYASEMIRYEVRLLEE